MRGIRHPYTPPPFPSTPLLHQSSLLIAYLLKSHSLQRFVGWKPLRHVRDVEGQLSHVSLRQGVTTVGLLLTLGFSAIVGFAK